MDAAGSRFIRLIAPVLLFLAAFIAVPSVMAASPQQAIDRHHLSCVMCHRTSTPAYDAAAAVPGDLDMSGVCMDCHHYSDNHHPVDFVPEKPVFAEFPLFEGRIRCLTCHDPHANQRLSYPKLLRGGPYSDRRDICYRCHGRDQYANFNPHIMLDESGNARQVNDGPICLICHATNPDDLAQGEPVTFKADVAFLCWRCHPAMNDSFFQTHFLVKPSKTTLRYMKSYGRINDVSLPLLNRNRITCSTCHNPHQAGVIRKSSAATGVDARARLRLAKRDICTGCHNL